MKLSDENIELFYKLMKPLLVFVNKKLEFIPTVSTVEDFDNIGFEDKAIIREALYEEIHLIDSFIDENPEDFPMKELAIVSKWKNFIKSDFFVERHLKKHAIFIGEDKKVYAVMGLMTPMDEIIPREALPVRLETVLLPFQDVIVYDGFIAPYNVFFGSGITEDLKHIYTKAKRRDEIIFSLDPDSPAQSKKETPEPAKNWKPLIKELTEKAAKLRGGAGQEEILSPAFSLVKASLELADFVTEKKIKHEDLYKCFEKIERHFNNIQKELYYFDD